MERGWGRDGCEEDAKDDEEDETHREGDAAVNNGFNICTESVHVSACDLHFTTQHKTLE